MNPNQSLEDTENALRDFIAAVLNEKFGENWIDNSGVSEDRILKWKERLGQEKISGDSRILYYSDFYDIQTILKKNWDLFSEIFGDLKTIEVHLSTLEGFRNNVAHRREILPHQAALVEGICGEIRTKIVKYRSKKETGEDCFARFEFAQDNLGNSWKVGDGPAYIKTGIILRPGDKLEFVVTASDPEGSPLQYRVASKTDWTSENKFSFTIEEKDIERHSSWGIYVRSSRPYQAHSLTGSDDTIHFVYSVLPKK